MKPKKSIFTALFLTVCLLAYSQTELIYDNPEHLKFSNIPMNGALTDFANKLTKQGFTIMPGSIGAIIDLDGTFLKKPCNVTISGTEKTKVVYQVITYLGPFPNNWNAMKKEYVDLKTTLQLKYGVGRSEETFLSPYTEGDGREIEALSYNSCFYKTEWLTLSGKISIHISNKNIAIYYIDKKNELIYKAEKSENQVQDDGWLF